MTDKKLVNYRLPAITINEIKWLAERLELTDIQVVIMAIDRMAQQEGYQQVEPEQQSEK